MYSTARPASLAPVPYGYGNVLPLSNSGVFSPARVPPPRASLAPVIAGPLTPRGYPVAPLPVASVPRLAPPPLSPRASPRHSIAPPVTLPPRRAPPLYDHHYVAPIRAPPVYVPPPPPIRRSPIRAQPIYRTAPPRFGGQLPHGHQY
eukprot:TRINITY_DN0_c1633_g1_i2.p1 TRINITY_DN0_c1633_g1~~TRINITY_DN0_c1633_g1_i2.p1  ORF type:complete len:147 (+),score=27.87 TRINITY_DN0_c1633_g1_i2:44-484(+)